MAIQLQLRKGNSLSHSTFTGALAEITVDTSKKTVVVHDGSTVGGFPLALKTDVANISSNVSALSTTNVSEGSNLYFTNARSRQAISVAGAGSYDNSTGVITITGGVTSVNGQTGAVSLTTANIAESGNLYFTDDRVYSNVILLNYITSSSLSGYATNSQLSSYATSSNLALKANIVDLTTANVTELTNLYFTNARSRQAISVSGAGSYDNSTGVITITGGVTSVNGQTGAVSLTTANIAESGNLYFTNTRVVSALSPGQSITIDANGRINSSVTTSGTSSTNVNTYSLTGDGSNTSFSLSYTPSITDTLIYINGVLQRYSTDYTFSGSNVVFTEVPVSGESIVVLRIYTLLYGNSVSLTTSNVTEGNNLYFTNTRVYSNVIQLGYITTSSLSGYATNSQLALYATNSQLDSYATVANVSLKANIVDLTTSNVTEGSNLYFTNARVYSNVIGIGYATTSYVDNSLANLVNSAPATLDTLRELAEALGNDASFSTTVTNTLAAKANVSSLTTANVTELTNLYFTNARSRQAISVTGAGSYDNSTGVITITGGVTSVNGQTGAVVLSTANITESGNLYFTNTRAIAALSAGQSITIDANGRINSSVTSSGTSSTNVSTYSFTGDGSNTSFSLSYTPSVTDTLVYINGVFQRYSTDYTFSGTNIVFTEVPVSGESISVLKIATTLYGSNTVSLSTSNVIEGSNLYFTNARSRLAISVSGAGSYDNSTGVITITGGVTSVAGATGAISNSQLASGVVSSGLISTGDIPELSNLYYTNARVYSNVIQLNYITASNLSGYATNSQLASYATNAQLSSYALSANLTTANVTEVNNLYFTNTRSRQSVSAGTGVSYNSSTGVFSIGQNVDPSSGVTFGNVIVTGNLNVLGNTVQFNANTLTINDPLIQVGVNNNSSDVVDLGFFGHYYGGSPATERHAGLFRDASDGQFKLFTNLDPTPDIIVDTANASYTSANLVLNYAVGRVTDISNHSTDSLLEGTNLYFTNARVYSNVTQLGYITSSSLSGYATNSQLALYATNSQLTSYATTSNVSLKANIADLNTSNVAEGANLYFTNARVVAALTAGQSITIDANGRINSTATGGSSSSGTVAISDYQVFPGGNSNITLNTSVTDAKSILVTIDGLLQIPTTDYTVNSTTLSWTSIPPANSTIEVKYFITGNAASYSTFTYTGDGTTSSFAAINGITKDNILVFENGIAQVPTTDYTVSGSNVLFTSAPVNGMGIQIRTLGGGGGGSASTGYSLSTLNSFPTGDYGNVMSSSIDAFGINILDIYNCMDPLGSIVSEDLGVLT